MTHSKPWAEAGMPCLEVTACVATSRENYYYQLCSKSQIFYQWWGSGSGPTKTGSGALYLERRNIFFNSDEWIFNIILNAFFFVFILWCQTFHWCPKFRRPAWEWQLSSDSVKFGPDLGLTEDDWHQKYENKKECF